MADPTRRLKAEARAAIDASLETIVVAKRAALEGADALRAQAAPQLAIVSGIKAEIAALAERVNVTRDAIAVLEPYRTLSEVAVFIGVLEASLPLYAALTAAASARAALAALVIPDPITVALAVSDVAAAEVQVALEDAFTAVLELGEES
ncbi:MAG: hypothetical protein HC933_08175 [Pleurocapsa sp. SU_196_0]|nr:hypothetical protein [Pleurocapsa sp. SU_196_0]